MGPAEAVTTCLRKYVTFSGRGRRSEYWWFFLFVILVSIAAGIADTAIFGSGGPGHAGPQILSNLVALVTFLPLLAAGWRRMHDTGRPGGWLLLPLAVGLLTGFGFFLGIAGFSGMQGAGPGAHGGPMAMLGLGGAVAGGFLQIVLGLLLLWWLTRPTQPGANDYGPEPA